MKLSAAARRHWAWWVGMAVISVGLLVFAGTRPPDSGTSDDRLYGLAEQLKCLQCVGESVAASQAPLAEQFREEIRAQMSTGSTDDEILAFFVDRYGTEVLLDPPSSGLGALVWVLPLLALGATIVVLGLAFTRWRSSPGSGTGPRYDEPVLAAGASAEPGLAEPGDAVSTGVGSDDQDPTVRAGSGARWRGPAVVSAVVVFAALAAWLLVGGAGERGDAEMTGGTGAADGQLASCQPLAMSDPEAGIACYDEILAGSPDDVEALTYRGWARIRSGDAAAGEADLERAVEVDPSYPDARVFLAVAATERGDFVAASEEMAQFWANEPSDVAVSVVESEGLERKIFFGLMSAPTRDCWQAAAASSEGGAIDQAFLDSLGSCLDGVLALDPGNRDARLSRALAHVGPDASDPAAARSLLDGLLADDPQDADALALLVSLDLAGGDLDAAGAGLEVLEDLPRGPATFLIGDAATLRAALDAAGEAAVPNPDGG